MKKLLFVIFVLLIGCNETASKKDFLENKESYDEIYKILSGYDFKKITYEMISPDLAIDTTYHSILKIFMTKQGVKEIYRFDHGIYFIKGKSGIGNDGYFRATAPEDSFVNYSIFIPLTDNWYRWYQD